MLSTFSNLWLVLYQLRRATNRCLMTREGCGTICCPLPPQQSWFCVRTRPTSMLVSPSTVSLNPSVSLSIRTSSTPGLLCRWRSSRWVSISPLRLYRTGYVGWPELWVFGQLFYKPLYIKRCYTFSRSPSISYHFTCFLNREVGQWCRHNDKNNIIIYAVRMLTGGPNWGPSYHGVSNKLKTNR